MRCKLLMPAVLVWAVGWCPSPAVAQSTAAHPKSGGTLLERLDEFGQTLFGGGRTNEKDDKEEGAKPAPSRTTPPRRARTSAKPEEQVRPRAGSVLGAEQPVWDAGQAPAAPAPAARAASGFQAPPIMRTELPEEPVARAPRQEPAPARPNVSATAQAPATGQLHERMSGLRHPLFASEGEVRVADRNNLFVPPAAVASPQAPSDGGPQPPRSVGVPAPAVAAPGGSAPRSIPNVVTNPLTGPSVGPLAAPPVRPSEPANPKVEGIGRPGRPAGGAESGGVLVFRQGPSLSVETIGPARIPAGKEATYEVVLHNSGQVAAEQVVLTLALPEHVDVLAAEAAAGTAESAKKKDEPGQIVWKLGRLEAMGRQRLVLRLVPRQNRPIDLAMQWHSAAVVSQAKIEVQEPKLAIALLGPREVQFGKGEVYRLEVTNTGNGDAENVAISLTPAGPGEKQAPATHRFGALAAGQRKSIEVELTARQTGDLMIQVEAGADGGVRAELAEKILVRRPSLKVEVEGPPIHFVGNEAAYRIRVSNPGSAPARNVTVTATLPSGTKFLASPQTARQGPEPGKVTWTLETVGAGAETTLAMSCDLSVPGTSKLEVRCQGDADLSASAAATTQVEAMANLALTVEDPSGPILLGGEATYVIRLQNRGSASATNVDVVVYFSAGFDPASAEGGRNKLGSGQVVFEPIASLAPGQSVALKVKAKAESAGNHVFRIEVRSEPAGTRLVREGTTRFYGTVAAGPAPTTAAPSGEKSLPSPSTVPAETRTADRRDGPSGPKAEPAVDGAQQK